MKEIIINNVIISPLQPDISIDTKLEIEIEFKVIENVTDFYILIEYLVDSAFLNHKIELLKTDKVNYNKQEESIKLKYVLPKTFREYLEESKDLSLRYWLNMSMLNIHINYSELLNNNTEDTSNSNKNNDSIISIPTNVYNKERSKDSNSNILLTFYNKFQY